MTFLKRLFILLTVFTTYGSLEDAATCNTNNTMLARLIEEYEEKICEARPTCLLTESLPESCRNLKMRNCMCDSRCSLYNDCCEDSPFQNNSSQSHVNTFKCASTILNGHVYMVTSCPPTWNHSFSILNYCQEESPVLDVLRSTPVTSYVTFITYRNLFCAACHNETEYSFWDVLVWYKGVDIRKTKMARENYQVQSSNASYNVEIQTLDNGSQEIEPTDASFILNTIQLNGTTSKMTLNNTWKEVQLYGVAEDNISENIRYCVADVLDSCIDPLLRGQCSNHTNYVFVGNRTYKNKYCAECHNVTSTNMSNCRNKTKTSELSDRHLYKPFILQIQDQLFTKIKGSCSALPTDLSDGDLLCPKPKQTSIRTGLRELKSCFPKNLLGYKPPRPCLVWRVTTKDDPDVQMENNSAVFLGTRYMRGKDVFWKDDKDQVTICGTYITPSSPILYQIENFITPILINVSIICLVLQLAAFQQLPELRNLSGKNLACFSLTLLVFYICYNFGPMIRDWLGSCRVTAVLSHYCLLSCFVWMFIMAYDCWLSLYRATSQFRTSGGKHALKFFIYCCICWGLPIVLIAYALYLELWMKKNAESCLLPVPGYGMDASCWMLSDNAKLYLYFIPASVLIMGNVCFFAHTVFMIYGNKKNSVNPNTKSDFRIYTRLALLMGLTWTIGIVNNVTDGDFSDVVGVMYDLLNMSQGALIFFGFTCKEKTVKLFLNKYRDNEFVSGALMKFMPKNTKDLTLTEIRSNSTDMTT